MSLLSEFLSLGLNVRGMAGMNTFHYYNFIFSYPDYTLIAKPFLPCAAADHALISEG